MNSGDLKKSGHIAGKNCIFDALFGIIEHIAQTVKFQKRTRIVIEYDPSAENWLIDVFTDTDKPIQTGNDQSVLSTYPTEHAAKQESEKRLNEMTNSTPKETVFRAMKHLDSLMESCVQDYQRERDRINGANNKEKLIELNKEFLPIIERIGVSIADMYRLVEKKDPA